MPPQVPRDSPTGVAEQDELPDSCDAEVINVLSESKVRRVASDDSRGGFGEAGRLMEVGPIRGSPRKNLRIKQPGAQLKPENACRVRVFV